MLPMVLGKIRMGLARSLPCLTVLVLGSHFAAGASHAYRLGGPGAGLAPSSFGYAFGGAQWTAYRAAVEDPANFGPGGIKKPIAITTTALTSIDPESLSGLDAFVAPWWADGDSSATQVADVIDFFLTGGDLVLLQDDSAHDEIGEQLGLPVAGQSDGSLSFGGFYRPGPFGTPPIIDIQQFGSRGYLAQAEVFATGGWVAASNGSNQITAAFWRRGAFAPGAGALLIVTDVDMWTSLATYAPLNSNGRFALNLTALLRPAPAYVLGGAAFASLPVPFLWDWESGTYLRAFRNSIENLVHFGAGGVAPMAIETVDLAVIDPGTLAGLDGLCVCGWPEAGTPSARVDAAVDFFLAGGDLFVMQNEPALDAVGERLGIPTLTAALDGVSSGGGPLFEGPFGHAVDPDRPVIPDGRLAPADVEIHGGTVVATHASGEITAAAWKRGEYAPGAGRLLIAADLDAFENLDIAGATGSPVTLNATAFVASTDAYVLAGPAASRTPSSSAWSWDGGTQLRAYRDAVEDRSNFGPAGKVGPRPITTVDLRTITAASLAQADGFVSAWWADAETTSNQANAVRDFFLAGGDLLLLQDDSAHDEIGETLGIPTFLGSDGSRSDGPAPLFDGPFGETLKVHQSGLAGQLSEGHVGSHNGTVAARNTAGQITAAVWQAGQYAPGAGRLLIVADVDMFATTTATYSPPNENGVFALNGTAFLRGPNVMAGPALALSPSSFEWAWAGEYLVDHYRVAVEDPANFGAGGIRPTAIDAIDLPVVDAANLSRVDAFVSSWWADGETSVAQRSAVIDFFRAGGDLILLQDDALHDGIGEALGLPTLPGAVNVSSGGAPLFLGPFGTATNIGHQGNSGRLDPAALLARGGSVVGRNAFAEVTAAFWPRDGFAPGTGRLLILTDVDLIAGTQASYQPLDDNGRFAMNATNLATPEPTSSLALFAGCALLRVLGSRRAGRR